MVIQILIDCIELCNIKIKDQLKINHLIMSFFGVELNAQINKLTMDIKLQLAKNKFSPNFRTIYRSFVELDPEVSGSVSLAHFQKALNNNGIFFKKFQFQAFEKAFGKENTIDWFAFMGQLRQPMGPLRRQLVENIFNQIDSQRKGKVNPEQLAEHFNEKQIEAFQAGRKSRQSLWKDFIGMLSIPENEITQQQFINFYDDLSLNFGHNDVFIRYVSSMWNHIPQKQQAATEEQIKQAIKGLRFKLVQKSKGTNDQFLLRKLFNEYDVNKNGYLSAFELDLMMKKLGTPAKPKIVEPMMIKMDKNKSGYIQYDQFKRFLFFDPYPI